jgi:hypothetical protein
VLVEWEESTTPVAAWQWVEDYKIPEIAICVSVGFLIADADHAIALAANVGDVRRERVQAIGIIRIPRLAVRRISQR